MIHRMFEEISEQPEILEQIARQNADVFEDSAELIKVAKKVYLSGAGSSFHAALFAAELLMIENDILPTAFLAGEIESFVSSISANDLVIIFSQSGETKDDLSAVEIAKKKGAKTLVLTNSPVSTLANRADAMLDTLAGKELAIPATKSFTAMLATFTMLSAELKNKYDTSQKLVVEVADDIEKILNNHNLSQIRALSTQLFDNESIYVIGRGENYPIALETALKIKETARLHAEAIDSANLQHGPMALINKDAPVLYFSSSHDYYETVEEVKKIKKAGAKVFVVSPHNNDLYNRHFAVADSKIYTPISSVVYGQLLAYFLALEKGLNPDQPEHLAKAVR